MGGLVRVSSIHSVLLYQMYKWELPVKTNYPLCIWENWHKVDKLNLSLQMNDLIIALELADLFSMGCPCQYSSDPSYNMYSSKIPIRGIEVGYSIGLKCMWPMIFSFRDY